MTNVKVLMAPTKKQVIAGVAAGVVLGGVVYALTSRKSKPVAEEDAFSAPIAKEPVQKTSEKPTGAPTAQVESPPTTSSHQFTREYSFRANEDNERMLEEALAEQDHNNRNARIPSTNKHDGSVTFAHLGVSMVPPAGWMAREEPSPMPNVAMITITKPEFAERQMNPEDMGSVPVIILSVEDISSENLDLIEFKEKSKQMALTQMMMMTNGMVQPHIKFDERLDVGPFRHCLEYAQSLPPYFELSVCNVLAVENGLAYVFQIMCSPKVMTTYKPVFMEIARTVRISTSGDAAVGRLQVQTAGGLQVTFPPSWGWSTKSKNGSLIEFTTPSTVKSESISLYESASAPTSSAQSTKQIDGVDVSKVMEGRIELREFKFGGFTAVVRPLQKSSIHINDAQVIQMIKSARLQSGVTSESSIFLNKEHGYSMAVAQSGKIIASRVGGGTVVYAPLGIPSDPNRAVEPEDQGPTVTIRVGDPETDPDCAESLESWEERMEAEKAGGTITNVQKITKAGQRCLTFQSKDMQEVGPGQRLEVIGKVFIFVRNGKTTLIRWETATGLWRKFESKMDSLLESLQFL